MLNFLRRYHPEGMARSDLLISCVLYYNEEVVHHNRLIGMIENMLGEIDEKKAAVGQHSMVGQLFRLNE